MPIVLLAGCIAAFTSCAQLPVPPAPFAAIPVGKDLSEFIQAYQTDRGGVSRFYDLPWSQTRFDRVEALDKEWQTRLAGVEFDSLDQQGKIDYILLRDELTSELAHQKLDRQRLAEMDQTLPFREMIQGLELARWKMGPVDSEAAAAKIASIPDQIKKVRERIEKGRKEPKKSEPDNTSCQTEDQYRAASNSVAEPAKQWRGYQLTEAEGSENRSNCNQWSMLIL